MQLSRKTWKFIASSGCSIPNESTNPHKYIYIYILWRPCAWCRAPPTKYNTLYTYRIYWRFGWDFMAHRLGKTHSPVEYTQFFFSVCCCILSATQKCLSLAHSYSRHVFVQIYYVLKGILFFNKFKCELWHLGQNLCNALRTRCAV